MNDIAPSMDAIRWDVTPEALMDLCEKYWGLLLPELKRLQREHEHGSRLSEHEERRRAMQAARAMNRRTR